ncbi:hypothetical protein [Micromonospora aurantiaca (nom. illeg.)]|uniref:hypothetical protein n=1 Tax=Micromonospora aurantiaca (nom. illeg.) TaxID=47850 RepID=UPI0011CD9EF6|nr:hypothetical protein [Micromonospora aurantiaca]
MPNALCGVGVAQLERPQGGGVDGEGPRHAGNEGHYHKRLVRREACDEVGFDPGGFVDAVCEAGEPCSIRLGH